MASKPTALVTGAAQGIGLACAEALLADGYRVAMNDINAESLQNSAHSLGNDVVSIAGDVGQLDFIRSLFERVESDVGPVKVLVNNAGISLPGDFLNYADEDFIRVLSVNLAAPFAATKHAANAMIKHNIKGSIINLSSVNAKVAFPTIPAYCASKGGIMQLTKSAALALAPYGIRVNAVGPGSIDTAMLSRVNASQRALDAVLTRTPLKRVGTPREVADVVTFLASDKASYITGETIYIDGGRLSLNMLC